MKYKASVLITSLIVIVLCFVVFAIKDEEVVSPISCRVFYCGEAIELPSSPITVNGRLYLPVDSDFEDLVFDKHFYNDVQYISLYDITQNLSLATIFTDDSIYFYDRVLPIEGEPNEDYRKAYLRLEDVSADTGLGNYTHENLEKMRVISDFMYENGQEFYVAWIPLYTNPIAGVQNDLIHDFSLYNADFIHTFDYITHHGGHIVIHGLTHQEGMEISGIGSEFGKDSSLTEEETIDRMEYAKETADFLGFDNDIFEFPHYSATEKQLKYAEKLFNVIYQQNMHSKAYGKIEKHNGTKYVPAPNGYLESKDKLPPFLDNIANTPKNQIPSMFVHPYMDFKNINCYTNGKERIFEYNTDGIFPQLVEKINESGMGFSTF